MRTIQAGSVVLYDFEPTDDFKEQVLAGLGAESKRIPSKFFYDEQGAALFERITELPEYYPTRTEMQIMRAGVAQMAACIGARCRLVEFGSGSSLKTRVLLDALEEPVAYVPVDISREHLLDSARKIAADYPGLVVQPVCADYTQPYQLPPQPPTSASTVAYYPGSTMGNFTWEEAIEFLRHVAGFCSAGGGLLLGVDLHKDKSVLEAAYNDSQGLTAAFNLNLLERINRELAADFDLEAFAHVAFYAEDDMRIEMHLESLREQTVRIDSTELAFAKGERILTEYSYKCTRFSIERLAEASGFAVEKAFTDPDELFSVLFLRRQ